MILVQYPRPKTVLLVPINGVHILNESLFPGTPPCTEQYGAWLDAQYTGARTFHHVEIMLLTTLARPSPSDII